jgi:3-phenylpropionate/cinnamic acid dioxygenase small subunit
MNHDPSKTSHYIGNEYYAELIANFRDWQTDENEVSDLTLRDSCRRFIEKESRFLETNRHDDWLDLFAAECLYWVPASLDGGDPRKEVAVAFDDRRRLEDRVFRLQNEYAWSQQPVSRTSRLVSNVSVFATTDSNIFMTRSNFLISELQAGDRRVYAGWAAHRILENQSAAGEDWQILVKQINLIDCDQNLRNPSISL